MKNIFKSLVAFKLSLIARVVIRRYRPQIVLVTGSVGKTSTKDAVAAVLRTRFFVRKSEKSFNSEFGVPFTILGVENPWCNPFAWFGVAKSTLALLFLPNHYPNMLVLEVGADRPGDLSRILRFAAPNAVVVTRLPEIPVHVEAYASPEAVREEEFSPAYALSAGAPLIISADDLYALDNAMRTPARVISYGKAGSATIRIHDIGFYEEKGNIAGMSAKVTTADGTGKIIVKHSIGVTQLLPVAAALAVAQAFDISLSEALSALNDYEPPPGRGRLLNGIHGSTIIDDSYNSSPAAVEEALATLKTFPRIGHHACASRRIAVLGDMLELGRYSVAEHERIAKLAGESADVIVTVGIRARAFATTSSCAEILSFNNSYEAASVLAAFIREGDIVLVKGSQSIRTERIVEALLADSADASKLVRQEKKWKEKI
ncbi:MAG: UDP-N-acetylmuramoyl-tripeptide--D-alanyl-D-alanine ligase [Candidatus Kaiserbacteria bacterium]|nr:UDP-N-acetylmuramoyl-tripeptide--D-alanyl-D-alanine ligase [Candidatus Kaiserbacteria bacterium]